MELRANRTFDRMKPQRGRTFDIPAPVLGVAPPRPRNFPWSLLGLASGAGLGVAMLRASAGSAL